MTGRVDVSDDVPVPNMSETMTQVENAMNKSKRNDGMAKQGTEFGFSRGKSTTGPQALPVGKVTKVRHDTTGGRLSGQAVGSRAVNDLTKLIKVANRHLSDGNNL